MKIKPMLKQKSTWAGIASILTGLQGLTTGSIDQSASIAALATGFGLIFMPEFIQGKDEDKKPKP